LKEYGKAADVYGQLVSKAPKNPVGYMKMAGISGKQEKWDEAVSWAEKAYDVQPDAPRIFSALVNLHVFRKQPEAALALCRERLEKNSGEVFTRDLMGQVYANMKNYAEAEKAFKAAIADQPLYQAPHNNLARLYLIQDKKADAVKNLEAALKADPKNQAAYITLGQISEQSGDSEKAIAIYRQALEEIPDFWAAANNLAFLMSEFGKGKADLEDALSFGKRAMEIKPETPEVLDTVGWIYYKLSDMKNALIYLEKAGEREPESPIINYHLGMALIDSGREGEALERLKKSLDAGGGFHGRDKAEEALKKLENKA